jgi:hypothetical protein
VVATGCSPEGSRLTSYSSDLHMAMPAKFDAEDLTVPVPAAPPSWEANYATALIVLDAVTITVAAAIALRLRFGPTAFQQEALWTGLVSAAFPPTCASWGTVQRSFGGSFGPQWGSSPSSRAFATRLKFNLPAVTLPSRCRWGPCLRCSAGTPPAELSMLNEHAGGVPSGFWRSVIDITSPSWWATCAGRPTRA